MTEIRIFTREDIPSVLEFERRLRLEAPDPSFWEADDQYPKKLENRFSDPRFGDSVSFLEWKGNKVMEKEGMIS